MESELEMRRVEVGALRARCAGTEATAERLFRELAEREARLTDTHAVLLRTRRLIRALAGPDAGDVSHYTMTRTAAELDRCIEALGQP